MSAAASLTHSRVSLTKLDVVSRPAAGSFPPSQRFDRSKLPGFEPTTVKFWRFEGGNDFYCGQAEQRDVQCWGSLLSQLGGSWADLAVGSDFACVQGFHNTIHCVGSLQQGEFEQHAWGLAAGPNHLCAAHGSESRVRCYPRPGHSALPVTTIARLKDLVVGRAFACGRDLSNKVHCWGKTEPLGLPHGLRARHLVAGDDFVCVASGSVRCFGRLPPGVPKTAPGPIASLAARGQTLCSVTPDAHGWCQGPIPSKSANVREYHLARTSYCATLSNGRLQCWGSQAKGQLRMPVVRGSVQAQLQPAFRKRLFAEFLAQLPTKTLPLQVTRKVPAELGGAIPPRYAVPLLGAVDHERAEFRYGVRVALDEEHGIFTAYDLLDRRLYYYMYTDAGELRGPTPFAFFYQRSQNQVGANGEMTELSTLQFMESVLDARLLFTTTTSHGHWIRQLAAASALSAGTVPEAGTREVHLCLLQPIRSQGTLTRWGTLYAPRQIEVPPLRRETGCDQHWPFSAL